MDSVIAYFQELDQHPLQRGAFFISTLVILWALESAFPLMELKYRKTKGKHAALNKLFLSMNHLA